MRRALPYLLTAVMAGSSACANTTLLPPDKQTDCDEVADSERCTDGGSAPSEPMESNEELEPIELACDGDGNLDGTGPFEIVASGDDFDSLAIAPDGTVFATGTIDGRSQQVFRVIDGEIDPFGKELWNVGPMLIDGEHMIAVGSNDNVAPAVLMTRLDTEQRRIVSRTRNRISALAADSDAVYWISSIEPTQSEESSRYELWRSMRETGEVLMLAELDDYNYGGLVALKDHLFLVESTNEGGSELVRIAKDGGGEIEAVQAFQSDNSLRTDGKDLFLFFNEVIVDASQLPVEAELHIMRVDGATLDAEVVFDTDANWIRNLAAGEGPYVYWTASQLDDEKVTLWRGLSDGSGGPQELGAFEGFDGPLTQHDGRLYWIVGCPIGTDDVVWKSHIVKLTN